MKKNIKWVLLVLLVLILLILTPVTSTRCKPSSSISNRTYIIGTHEFTSEMALTIERIDIALLTSKNDVIYYKNHLGEWINANTGEYIEIPKCFKITHVNLVEKGAEI